MNRRLECMGHLIRTENSRIPKVALDAKLKGKRKVGRPEARWLDDIKAEVKMIGIKGWRRKAQDRWQWMDFIREAKVKLQDP
jgi:hypothetical protein